MSKLTEIKNLLSDLLELFFRDYPDDVLVYITRHFNRLLEERERKVKDQETAKAILKELMKQIHILVPEEGEEANIQSVEETTPPPTNTPSSSDSEIEDKFPTASVLCNRRQSVFSESFSPEPTSFAKVERKPSVLASDETNKQRLIEALHNLLLFRSMKASEMDEILDDITEKKLKAGDVVTAQGEEGEDFYIVKSGTFVAVRKNDEGKEIDRTVYNGNGSFGEIALLYNSPRTATVTAVSDGILWVMNRKTFRKNLLQRSYLRRQSYESIIEKVEIFNKLSEFEKFVLNDAFEPCVYAQNAIIVKQGSEAKGMYFVQEGKVRIVKTNEETNEIEECVTLEKGSYFGELALINKRPTLASVYAASVEVTVAFLGSDAFERLLGSCMDILKRKVSIEGL